MLMDTRSLKQEEITGGVIYDSSYSEQNEYKKDVLAKVKGSRQVTLPSESGPGLKDSGHL